MVKSRQLVFTLRWVLISISIPLATLISLEAINFLLSMARGTSGLGVRSGFVIGFRVIGGAGGLFALGLPWNAITFMCARVWVERKNLKVSVNIRAGNNHVFELKLSHHITLLPVTNTSRYHKNLALHFPFFSSFPSVFLSPCFRTAGRGWCLCGSSRSWTASPKFLWSGPPESTKKPPPHKNRQQNVSNAQKWS